MRIGSVVIDPPVVLAPMSGVNDRSFRLLCREQGASAVWTGLISANALRYGSEKTRDLLTFLSDEHPVCVQVFGAEPEIVAAAAAEAEGRGADLIDINMGCSVPKVVKGGAGVALMADPGRAEAMVRACVEAVRAPVLVKMRAGWANRPFDPSTLRQAQGHPERGRGATSSGSPRAKPRGDKLRASGEGAVEMARRCERAGASAVTVHPREAKQGFRGSADWSVIARVKEAVGIPVIGNGDVRSPGDAVRMRDETGCDAVMVGRRALGYPWIFRQIGVALKGDAIPPSPSVEERLALAARHVQLAVADRGPKVGVREMRKHISWYLRGAPMARAFRERANHATTEAELLALLAEAREAAAGTWQETASPAAPYL